MPNLYEIWCKRYILWVLLVRDVKQRYKQTLGGILWAVAQPVLTMIVFSLLFGKVLKVPSYDIPYPLFAFAGLIPWSLFSAGLAKSTNSLTSEYTLITRVFIPRSLFPIAGVLSPLVDFVIALVILMGMVLIWGYPLTWHVLAIIPLVMTSLAFTLGLGMWLSSINVQFRDVGWALPSLLQLGMFVCPVAYGSAMALGGDFYWAYQWNPMSGVIEGFRWALLGLPFPGAILWRSGLVSIVALVSGALFFCRREPIFADIV